VTLGNDNGTDGQTDRVRRIMRSPPREEGRIINARLNELSSLSNNCPSESVYNCGTQYRMKQF